MGKKIAVYTVLLDDYDNFRGQEYYHPDCDYFLITDGDIEHDIYEVVKESDFRDSLQMSRVWKILGHPRTNAHRRTIYHDANIVLHKPIYKYVLDDKFYALQHPSRSTVWEEFDACIKAKKDEPIILHRQRAYYESVDWYKGDKLAACGVLMRNNEQDIRKFSLKWWEEVAHHSHRDQLSFYFAKPPEHQLIPWDVRYFSVHNHK